MASFNIDGLTYTDKLPHSRIERILYSILKKQGGGQTEDSLVVDDPTDVGNGLSIIGNKLSVTPLSTISSTSTLPITSDAMYTQINNIDTIMSRI